MVTQDKKEIQLTLKGEGLSYETKIGSNIASHIMALCMSDVKKEDKAQPSSSNFGFAPLFTVQEPLLDYIKRHNPRRNPDKILTFAGYLKESTGKQVFRSSEIKDLFREAGEILPANFSRDFQWAFDNKWLFSDPKKKGYYYITTKGLDALQKQFSKDLIKKSRNKSAKRSKKRKGTKSRE